MEEVKIHVKESERPYEASSVMKLCPLIVNVQGAKTMLAPCFREKCGLWGGFRCGLLRPPKILP